MTAETLLKILEAANYLSTIGILVVAIIGLRQLKLTKSISNTSSKRDAMTLASDQVRYYLSTIVDQANELYLEEQKKGVTVFKLSTFELTEKGVKVRLKPNQKVAATELISIVPVMLPYLNSLESFATYFTSGVADEALAYKSVGRTFCNSVKTYMPAIATLGKDEHFQDLIELYRLWQDRIEEEKLLSSREEIEKKLSKMNGKNIVPLGVDNDD